ncbi:hypothetical protein Gotur_024870, partial [Gossypium turneri]
MEEEYWHIILEISKKIEMKQKKYCNVEAIIKTMMTQAVMEATMTQAVMEAAINSSMQCGNNHGHAIKESTRQIRRGSSHIH